MDPNKIHIDELVRQRLQGGEEEPRPGAWITMRELLDKQMPVGRPAGGGFGWGRAARWTTGLVLLTLLAGGYGAMEIRREGRKPLAENTAARMSGENITVPAAANTPVAISNATRTAAAPNEEHAASAAKSSVSEATSTRLPRAARIRTTSASAFHSNAHSSLKESHASSTGNAVAVDARLGNTTTQNADASTANDAARATIARTYSTHATGASARRSRHTTSGRDVRAAKIASATAASKSILKSENVAAPARARRTSNIGNRSAEASQNAQAENPSTLASASRANTSRGTSAARRNTRGGRAASSALDSAKTHVQHDTLSTIRIAQRYLPSRGSRAGRYVADTLVAEPTIIERRIPESMIVSANTPGEVSTTRTRRRLFARRPKTTSKTSPAIATAAATPKTALPAAASPAPLTLGASQSLTASASSASETLVPLSSLKVSSTKNSKLQYSAQEQLQDAMRKARFAFGQMQLYTGVTGGFNASVGGTSMGGFHAGLFGLLAISDHWSAGIEGKFVQRFNRGTELQDPYFQYRATSFDQFTTPDGEAYKVYRVTTDSFQHYYKVSTLEAIELPVYARYSFHRFHGFAGANLAFGLGVKNIERVERFAGRESAQRDTVLATAQYAPPANTTATVGLNDFGPRFGLGYTAGLGFQASPAVLVDVRMTQLVWDNRSKTPGGLRVSQTFYRVPSLQLSIGYRFSQRSQRR